jgi:exonuclease VII small subunit
MEPTTTYQDTLAKLEKRVQTLEKDKMHLWAEQNRYKEAFEQLHHNNEYLRQAQESKSKELEASITELTQTVRKQRRLITLVAWLMVIVSLTLMDWAVLPQILDLYLPAWRH